MAINGFPTAKRPTPPRERLALCPNTANPAKHRLVALARGNTPAPSAMEKKAAIRVRHAGKTTSTTPTTTIKK